MKKINEQTKSFLLYGIEDVIKPKEIYKLDGAILFLVFLFFFLFLFFPIPLLKLIYYFSMGIDTLSIVVFIFYNKC